MAFDITEAASKMSALQEQMKKLREEATAEGKKAFSDACKSLFAEHPELVAFRWTQYTPYFCDGDPCEFGVKELYVRTTAQGEDDGDYGDGFVGAYQLDGPLVDNVKAVFALLDQDACLELFGDHVRVTVTADGVDTSDYEHD